MTTIENQFNNEDFDNWQAGQRRGRVVAGIFIIITGIVYLFKQMGYFVPEWFFTWPMILIAVGIVSGVKHNFKRAFWLVPFLIGGVFLAGFIVPDLSFVHYKIPILLFIVGTIMIFKPKRRHYHYSKFNRKWKHDRHWIPETSSSEDYFVMTNLFSGTKKIILSKDFKGGEINNSMGGCEINLMQAQIVSQAVITINQRLSGVKLVVPANWVIKSDLHCVLSGVQDERPPANTITGENPVLILRGSLVMAGIEIVSH